MSLLLGTAFVAGGVAAPKPESPRSFATGRYRNLFKEIGHTQGEIDARLEKAFAQLFHGDPKSEAVYFESGPDEAYIMDIGSNDVRSEGMSYGLMVAVQMGKREEFDRLWRWTKRHMQHQTGPWKGYLAWQCKPNGEKLSAVPAPDGEEYAAMALFFAAGRWKPGKGSGAINYRKEADAILHTMLHKIDDNGGIVENARNAFDAKRKQVVFVPNGDAAGFTDPSYHLPGFYELWARWAKEDRPFWRAAAKTSRAFFQKAAHPVTGLFPDYSSFDGKPMRAPWDPKSTNDNFQSDAFRVGGNIAMDWNWFGVDPWQVGQSNRLLAFLAAQKPDYVAGYTLDGKPLVDYKAGGLVAMNAVVAGASNSPHVRRFVQELWDAPVPTGQWRYYDGMLQLLGLLHTSGRFRIWTPK